MSNSDLIAIPCTWMRGGTSKGAFFLAEHLPEDVAERNALLLRVMGSPDQQQIDGIGGADPLTSKVAIVSASARDDADVDYLFLQVFVDRPLVSDGQNCGNILSGVAQFAIEKGLVEAREGVTDVRVFMLNTQQVAIVTVETSAGLVRYRGTVSIDGVPGTAAAVQQNFPDATGSSCGTLLPTGNVLDVINGVEVTLIDHGMPVVVLRAADLGITGYESREELDGNAVLKERLEHIRLIAGEKMNLGDVCDKSVPKMSMVAPPLYGGCITTRTFIPHRCHASIGVLGAISVATACLLPGSPAAELAETASGNEKPLAIEHPIGETSVVMDMTIVDGEVQVKKAAILRTARKLFEGYVFV